MRFFKRTFIINYAVLATLNALIVLSFPHPEDSLQFTTEPPSTSAPEVDPEKGNNAEADTKVTTYVTHPFAKSKSLFGIAEMYNRLTLFIDMSSVVIGCWFLGSCSSTHSEPVIAAYRENL